MEKRIKLMHGSGGRLTHELVETVFRKNFSNSVLDAMDDSAVIKPPSRLHRLCYTTDSYVVKPAFFPGGNIGKLAVCGTVNDLAVNGAEPAYISCGFIIEEGMSLNDLKTIASSMKKAAASAGVHIACGDTKVVEKGACDNVFINTSGIGFIRGRNTLSSGSVRTGDTVIINGTAGDHGAAVLSAREKFEFSHSARSDCAPLNGLVRDILSSGARVRFMRDPTRGGVAAVLNEICSGRDYGIELNEDSIPVRGDVSAFCEILGMDPLYLANEGKLIAIVHPDDEEKALNKMYNNKYGRNSRVIGKVTSAHKGRVTVATASGGSRILDMPAGDQLPRIC